FRRGGAWEVALLHIWPSHIRRTGYRLQLLATLSSDKGRMLHVARTILPPIVIDEPMRQMVRERTRFALTNTGYLAAPARERYLDFTRDVTLDGLLCFAANLAYSNVSSGWDADWYRRLARGWRSDFAQRIEKVLGQVLDFRK